MQDFLTVQGQIVPPPSFDIPLPEQNALVLLRGDKDHSAVGGGWVAGVIQVGGGQFHEAVAAEAEGGTDTNGCVWKKRKCVNGG